VLRGFLLPTVRAYALVQDLGAGIATVGESVVGNGLVAVAAADAVYSPTRVATSQVEALGSATHIFGHSHLDVDRDLGGTRYVQAALGYPNDRWRGDPLPLKVSAPIVKP
jgi:hypothetical protein